MTSRNASIAGGSAGIVGWVLFFVAFVLAPTPPTLGASATEIVPYGTEHHNATLIAAFLFATTATLFTMWAGILAARLRDAEREGAWLYLAFLAGVIVTLSVNVSASFIWMALSGRGWTAGDPTAQTLSDIINLRLHLHWLRLGRLRRSGLRGHDLHRRNRSDARAVGPPRSCNSSRLSIHGILQRWTYGRWWSHFHRRIYAAWPVVAGRFNSDDCSRAGDHKDALSFLSVGVAWTQRLREERS